MEPKNPIVVSPAQEVAWGEKALKAFLEDRPLGSDENLAIRVDSVGRRVAKVSDRPGLLYRFLVVKGEDLQAFSFPGGTVCLTESLARLYSSDDELAFALGHELAHLALRHHVAQLRMREALKAGAPGEEAMLKTVKSLFDRDSELDADRFGALYAVRAGFRYTATYQALNRLRKVTLGAQEDPEHPGFRERISALRSFRRELERSLEAFDRGVEALQIGNADEAISMLNLFVAEFPNSLSGRINFGASFLARVRLNSGTPLGLAEVLPILPEPGIVLRGFIDVVDLNHARDNFQLALEIQPEEVLAQAGLGLVHTRLGQYDEAREQLNKARSTSPRRPELPLCLGNVEFLAEFYPKAATYYQAALKLHPGWPEARKNLALAYEKLGKLHQARDLWSSLKDHEKLGMEARRRLKDLGKGEAR